MFFLILWRACLFVVVAAVLVFFLHQRTWLFSEFAGRQLPALSKTHLQFMLILHFSPFYHLFYSVCGAPVTQFPPVFMKILSSLPFTAAFLFFPPLTLLSDLACLRIWDYKPQMNCVLNTSLSLSASHCSHSEHQISLHSFKKGRRRKKEVQQKFCQIHLSSECVAAAAAPGSLMIGKPQRRLCLTPQD